MIRHNTEINATRSEVKVEQKIGDFETSRTILILIIVCSIAGLLFAMMTGVFQKTSTFTIVIQSDTSWIGTYGTKEEGSRSVQGEGDATFYCEGSVCSVSFQKQTGGGYLQISIYVDGKLKALQSTTADFGVVAASAKR
ncbi:MAG: hypothetical protein ACUVTL_08425 [Thermoproteota archaeon]